MKRIVGTATTTFALGMCTLAAMAAQGALRTYYADDPVGRNVVMIESRAPLETMVTTTGAVKGEVKGDANNVLDKPSARFEVDLTTLDTGISMRNDHMRGEAWLDTAKYPKAVFTLTSLPVPVTGGAAGQKAALQLQDGKTLKFPVVGNLEFHGVTKAVKAEIELTSTAANKDTAARLPGDLLHIRATFPLKLDDFGVNVPAMAQTKIANVQNVTVDIFTSTELPKPQG